MSAELCAAAAVRFLGSTVRAESDELVCGYSLRKLPVALLGYAVGSAPPSWRWWCQFVKYVYPLSLELWVVAANDASMLRPVPLRLITYGFERRLFSGFPSLWSTSLPRGMLRGS